MTDETRPAESYRLTIVLPYVILSLDESEFVDAVRRGATWQNFIAAIYRHVSADCRRPGNVSGRHKEHLLLVSSGARQIRSQGQFCWVQAVS